MPSRNPAEPEPDLKRALKLVMQMMAIPGPSGQEGKVMQFIVEQLRRGGLPKSAIQFDRVGQRSPLGGEVGNLIVRLGGTAAGPRRLLMAHVDTVPLCVGARPIKKNGIVRSADRNTGAGADNRSGAAAVLTAALTILKKKLPHPPLTLFWPVQEEVGLIGARFVSLGALGRPKLAFNFDSGDPARVILAATGAERLTIDIKGVASHAGVHPELGVSAITIAALAVAALENKGYLGKIEKGRRRGTSNVGVVRGGQATNVVADRTTLAAEVRSHNVGFRRTILGQFERAFEQAAQQVRSAAGQCGQVHIDVRHDYEAFKLAQASPSVAAARSAVVSALGVEPTLESVDGGLDANWLTNRGIPTVTLGAGQHGAHTVDELLNIEEFEQGCRVALRLAMQ